MNKTMMIIIVMCSIIPCGYGQKDTVFIKQIYADESTSLVSEKIINIDSISKNDLMVRFENWAGQNYRNYSEVRTSKTETQITLLYITSSFIILDMYVIMIVEFKDSKIRIRIYDDGNVYKPGSYIGNNYISGISGRTYKINSYFRNPDFNDEDGMIVYRINPGVFNFKEKRATGALNYKNEMEKTIIEIENYIKKPPLNKEAKSDW